MSAHTFFQLLSIRSRVILIVSVISIILVALTAGGLNQKWQELSAARQSAASFEITRQISLLVYELQKERGISAGSSDNNETLSNLIIEQRRKSDLQTAKLRTLFRQFRQQWQNSEALPYISKINLKIQTLATLRHRIDSYNQPIKQLNDYSALIELLLNYSQEISSSIISPETVHQFNSYLQLSWLMERSGQERGTINGILGIGSFDISVLLKANGYISQQEMLLQAFQYSAKPLHAMMLTASLDSPVAKKVMRLRQSVTQHVKMNDLLNELHSSIGYGGLIHTFKNYVIRGDMKYERKFHEMHDLSKFILQEIRELPNLDRTFMEKISDIENMIDAYHRHLQNIQTMRSNGEGIKEIDHSVKVDDQPAFEAIQYLRDGISHIDQNQWWSSATERMDKMREISLMIEKEIVNQIEQRLDSSYQLMLYYLSIGLILFMLIAVFGYYLIRYVAGSLTHIARQLEDAVHSEVYNPLLSEPRQDEIGMLVNAFNNLITQRQSSELLLRKLSSSIEQTSESMLIIDNNHIIEYANPATEQLSGFSPSHITGENINLFNYEHAIEVEFTHCLSAGTSWRGRATIQHKEGSSRPIILAASPIVDEHEKITHLIIAQQNISELEEARLSLEEQNLELADALVLAKEAAKSKSQFLATMSHEIRTPLNGVLGLTELVLDSKLTIAQRESLETVLASGETLLTILNDILDFSKMEAGQFELSDCEFSPNDLVEHITKLYSKEAHRKNIELIASSVPKLTHHLIGDPDRLRQILMNLLSNAIKFTDKGEVLLQVESLHEDNNKMNLRFSVRDSGIGISPEDHHKLFENFSQLDASHARKYGGTGLGLSIANKLVGLMGGKICVESTIGKGCRFWFEIEFAKGESLPDLAIDHEHEFKQWRALIVDDNRTNQHVLHHMVNNWGMRSDSVDGGKQALETLIAEADADSPYQIALIDHMMPEMNGRELALQIKQTSKLKDLKVVLLSSLDDVFDINKKKEDGLDAFLRKPIHHSALYDLILSIMGMGGETQVNQLAEVHSERGHKILLTEDVLVNQMVAIGMLKKIGLTNIDIANNGLEAVDQFSCGKYALILMDLQMPEMDGYTAVKKIRAIEQSQHAIAPTPIIALTAHAFADEKKKSLEIGMNDLITKPLTGAKLEDLINHWLPIDLKLNASPDHTANHNNQIATLDDNLLRRLHQDMGGGIGMIIDMFVAELPAQVETICQALQDLDEHALKEAAHRLKGSSSNIGALALKEICIELEHQGEHSNLPSAHEQIVLLRTEVHALLLALHEPWLEEIR